MKKIVFAICIMTTMAMNIVAQDLKFTQFTNKADFTASRDGRRWNIHNELTIQLPAKTGDGSIPVKRITECILTNSFPLLDKSTAQTLKTTEAIKTYMRIHLIDKNLPTKNLRPTTTPARNSDNEMSAEVQVGKQCIGNDILTMCIEWNDYLGGAHGSYGKHYFFVNIRTGEKVNPEKLLDNDTKRKVLILLEDYNNVKKYYSEGLLDNEDAEEIATEIRGLDRDLSYFPEFYIDNGILHITFQPYDVAPYALGMPEFDIPLSVLNPSVEANASGTSSTAIDGPVHDMVEVNAQFPGGDEACYKWISEHIIYPDICKKQGVQGRVFVKFIVTKTGDLVDAKVTRSPDDNLSKEALRVVSTMPKWKPARKGGQAVNSYFNLPVMFRLQ